MDSLRKVHPDWQQYVLLADRPAEDFDPEAEAFQLAEVKQLPLPQPQRFLYRYNIIELNTAVKPWFLEWIFQSQPVERVVYLDPDIYVYQPLREIQRAFTAGSLMLLTPHLTRAVADDLRPGDHDILKAGSYNLGFLALARHPETAAFLDWWKSKLEHHCRVDMHENLFLDQRWMDLVPGMFRDVHILRHEGYNVAYWNLGQRKVRKVGGVYQVNDRPLAFFHFSGLDPLVPGTLSRHQNRFILSDLGDVQGLVADYCKDLKKNGLTTCKNLPYAFSTLADGTPISDMMRCYYSKHPHIQELVGDAPFARDHDYLNEPWGAVKWPLITQLMRHIWETRGELQRAFPDIERLWRDQYAQCFVTTLAREEAIPERYVIPARTALEQHRFAQTRPRSIMQAATPIPFQPDTAISSPRLKGLIRICAKLLTSFVPVDRTWRHCRAKYAWMGRLLRIVPPAIRHQFKTEILHWTYLRPAVQQSWRSSLSQLFKKPAEPATERASEAA
jgi:hypothetical protein